MLTLLLIGMLTLAFDIKPVKADWTWTETIYIRADGSVDPPTAPISTVDTVTYTLTENIVGDVPQDSSAIVVERDNIVVDGADHTLKGTWKYTTPELWEVSKGIDLTGRSNVTTKNMKIKAFHYGIGLKDSSNNNISGNSITNNKYGIYFEHSSNNIIYHNDLIGNRKYQALCLRSRNTWDNGTEGNYWSNYTGEDQNCDGIGDTPHAIDENNQDNYPLMSRLGPPPPPFWTQLWFWAIMVVVGIVALVGGIYLLKTRKPPTPTAPPPPTEGTLQNITQNTNH